jgi:hypothetical protein
MLLVFDPLVASNQGRVRGLEALLRWQHPEFGLLRPGHFIRLAEENGAIVALGDWVLREACAKARQWREQGLTELTVAVHVVQIMSVRDATDVIRHRARGVDPVGRPVDLLVAHARAFEPRRERVRREHEPAGRHSHGKRVPAPVVCPAQGDRRYERQQGEDP